MTIYEQIKDALKNKINELVSPRSKENPSRKIRN